ncbi:arginine-ornithine antiporter [Levilactobacillus brevis]|uniref:Arginine-ornithine antiporter n=1 Tax=Levilactobacillus brevis TaxID=1580 RepID=A0AA41EPW5_LEVBR|nr:arginine-ornithine antiporter [Levilactobacillus brevis]MBS0947584.1 arginine-ornithine antiporter [Levilactobacillus brevis]MBS1010729.1 arginine-ornithine antiporter [Levilactobacillus brevis]
MDENKGLSMGALTAAVVTSSIGSGVFTLTSSLAGGAAAGPVLLAWLVVSFGILMLALSLNNLLQKNPEAEGVQAYAQAGFGNFAGFVSGWGYWLSAWLGNVAFATVLMSSLGYFFPLFKGGQNVPSVILASVVSWGLTYIVNRGVESAAAMNTIITICKLIPLFTFIIVGIFVFKGGMFTAHFWSNVSSGVAGGANIWTQFKSCLMIMMWVFVGVEGASMLSSRAKSKSEAGRATIIGIICLLIIYVLASVLPYGYLSQDALAKINQPAMLYIFQDMVGTWGGAFIGVGLIIAILGSWLSWTMLPADTTMLMAEEKLLPAYFGKKNKNGAPTFSLVLTAALIQIFLLVLLFSEEAYNFALSLCTAAIVVCYIFVGAYQVKFSYQNKDMKQFWIGFFALLFQVVAITLAGLHFLMLVCIGYLPGIYFYYRAKKDYSLDGGKLTKMEILYSIAIVAFAIISIVMVAMGAIQI